MGNLFLARHSITEASEAGRNLGASSDPPLTKAGEALAERLGASIAAELRELPHDDVLVFTSPAARSVQTASAVARALGLDPGRTRVEFRLEEIDYGAWEGLTAEECRARDPELRATWERDPWSTRCPGGESGQEVAARAFPVLEGVARWLGIRPRVAVVVAHNHVNRLWLCAKLGLPMSDYRERITQDPAGYSLVTYGDRGTVVRRVNSAPA